MILRANPMKDADKDGNNRWGAEYGYLDGKPVNYETRKTENGQEFRVLKSDGTYEKLPVGKVPVDEKTWNKRGEDTRKAVVNQLKAPLRRALINVKGASAEDEAERYAGIFDQLRSDLPAQVDPQKFAKMAELTINDLLDGVGGDGTKLTEEGLRKSFHTTAYMTLRPTAKELFYVGKGKDARLIPPATRSAFNSSVHGFMNDRGVESFSDASDMLIQQWQKAVPENVKKRFTSLADKNGTTAFVEWVNNGMPQK